MTQKESLTNAILKTKNSVAPFMFCFMKDEAESVADSLLADGVIIPPCKVGEIIYLPWLRDKTKEVVSLEVTRIVIENNQSYVKTNFNTDDEVYREEYNNGKFDFDDFGKTVFLTEEQAKQALVDRLTELL